MSVEITQAERSRWQRRAAAELAAILRMHPDLPVLAWTVGSAGSVLLGRVVAPLCAPEERACFDTWTTALGLQGGRPEYAGNLPLDLTGRQRSVGRLSMAR